MRTLVLALALCSAVAGSVPAAAGAEGDEQPTAVVRIDFGELPSVPAIAGGYVWVLDRRANALGKIDPATNAVAGTLDLVRVLGERRRAWDLDAARGSLWVTVPSRRLILEIDPSDGEVASVVRPRGRVADLYVAHGSLWFTRSTRRGVILVRLNPKTGKRAAVFRLGRGNTGVIDVIGFGPSVWVVREHARHVRGRGRNPTFYVTAALWRIDPGSNRVKSRAPLGATYTRGSVNPVVGDVASARSGLWMSRVHERRIVLMEPATAKVLDVQPLPELELPWPLEVLRGDVWVADVNRSLVARVDPAADAKTFVGTGGATTYLARGFGSVWAPVVDDAGEGAVVRLTPQ